MASPLVGVAAINAVGFGVYGNVQRRLPDPDSIGSAAVAGMVAGFAQVGTVQIKFDDRQTDDPTQRQINYPR